MLRPMANLFAVADQDPGFLDLVEARLLDTAEFATVWRPAPGWLAAQAPLPESSPAGVALDSPGFAFAEGGDRLEQGVGPGWLDQVGELSDRAPARLAELPGDFSFLRFRPDGTALAVRSCAGAAPLYIHRRQGGRTVIATLLRYFTRFLPDRFEPDPLVDAGGGVTEMFMDGRTFVRGVSILPRASYTEISRGRAPRSESYWDPRPAVGAKLKATPEHARELRALLIGTLERDLDPKGRNLLALSGGVDSSSVGALAAGVVGRRLSSWSMIPGYEPERSHELSFIEPLVSHFGIDPARRCELTESVRRRWMGECPALPFPIVSPLVKELPRILSEQEISVVVGGEFGDEVCGGWVRITDWVRHTSPAGLARRPSALPLGPRDYLRWTRRRLLDVVRRPVTKYPSRLPPWVHPEVERIYRAWLRGRRAAIARDPRPLKELAEYVAADLWLVMNWEGLTPLGVRRCLPFFNRETLELAFRCHPNELLGPGEKRLLREAVRDDVPARNLFRPDKGAWGHPAREWRVSLEEELPAGAGALVRPDWFPRPPDRLTFGDAEDLLQIARLVRYLEDGARGTR